jgi:hypothetical protein
MQYANKPDQDRLDRYEAYEALFMNDHKKAFEKLYPKMRLDLDYKDMFYVSANLAAMLSELSADMLFEEFPTIRIEGDDNGWLSALYRSNNLKQQLYESAIEASYRGDAVFKIRAKDGELLIEDINPMYYFPEYNPANVREEPTAHVFHYPQKIVYMGETRDGVFIERHEPGVIRNMLYLVENGEMTVQLDVTEYLGISEEEPTNIDDFLVFHLRNYRVNSRYFGISDYKDIAEIMYSINNRMTLINSVLDEHGKPILLLPPGVNKKKDAHGNEHTVPKKYIQTIEYNPDKHVKPEYVVWDAKLEVTFNYIDRMMELFYMTTGTNSAAFGLDSGGFAESGRALKFKLLRTIAKKHKKQLYYDPLIKNMLYTAQVFARNNNLLVEDKRVDFEPVHPDIKWEDGIINDMMEQVEIEAAKLQEGLTTKVDAIQSIDNLTETEAQEKIDRIKEEKQANAPQFTASLRVPPTNQDQEEDTN